MPLLSKILERISLLYFIIADLDDEVVDSREITAIQKLFKEWADAQAIPSRKDSLIQGRVLLKDIRRFKHPDFIFKEALDFLSLHLTKSNMLALSKDLKTLAEIDNYYSSKEEKFIETLASEWELDSERIVASKELISGHFCQAIRLKREVAVTDLLRKTFQIDSLLPLVKLHEREITEEFDLHSRRMGVQGNEKLFPKIKRITDSVCESLKVDNIFHVLVDNDFEKNASILTVLSSYGRNFIVLTSELINSLTDEELKFVIGHEIGHWMFNNSDLDRIQHFAYSNVENRPSLALQNLLSTWEKLAEFSSDRIGLLACGSLSSAISALYKICIGIDPEKNDFDPEKYLSSIKQNMPGTKELEVFRDQSHPPFSLRLLALVTFSNSDLLGSWKKDGKLLLEDPKLTDSMNEIVDLLDFTTTSSLESKRLQAIALGGVVLSEIDEFTSEQELNKIRDILHHFVLNPDPILKYVEGVFHEGLRNPFEILDQVLTELIHMDENEKFPLFTNFVQIALSDGDLKPSETTLLYQIGELLQIPPDEVFIRITRILGVGVSIERKIPKEMENLLRRKEPFHFGSLNEKIALAKDENTEIPVLESLGRDIEPDVRLAVLFNDSAPDDLKMDILDSRVVGALARENFFETSLDDSSA